MSPGFHRVLGPDGAAVYAQPACINSSLSSRSLLKPEPEDGEAFLKKPHTGAEERARRLRRLIWNLLVVDGRRTHVSADNKRKL